jgi:2-keto-4-pentenoate hydratase/2-oxohepta-3-ene-1,7-dioic acid hydratase in catechol pathway
MSMLRRFARIALDGGRAAYVEIEGGNAYVLTGAPWLGASRTGEAIAGFDDEGVGPLPRLAPVDPRKILCIGRNYRAHAKEMGNEVPVEPMLFLKPTTALLDPGGAIELPPPDVSSRVDHEGEVAVVIGARLKRVDAAEAKRGIFGVTAACDVTARDLQKKDGQWWRAKGADTFCPVGPVVVMGLELDALDIECKVNGEQRQKGNTRDMIFAIGDVLAHVSRVVTLEPGDLVLTGSPEGVGPIHDGDNVEISVSGVGHLRVRVEASPDAARRDASV